MKIPRVKTARDASTGYIVFGHGSSVESANQAVRDVADKMAARARLPHVETAFLELGRPDLAGAVQVLALSQVTRIVVVPYFLTLGKHLQRDLPKLAQAARAAYPELEILLAPPLDGHPALLDALLERALAAADQEVTAGEVRASQAD